MIMRCGVKRENDIILTLEAKSGKGHYSKHGYKVFTEHGLYMLATILTGERAVRTTLAIIETYAQVRAMVRDMEALQSLKDGSVEQASKLTQTGHKSARGLTRGEAANCPNRSL